MSSLLNNPKLLGLSTIVLIVLFLSLAGGALGNEFGGGFLSAPIAHIQLPAESITMDPLFWGFRITNTMIATWATILVLVVISFFATRDINEIPRGLQNVVEVVVEFFLNLCSSVAGPAKARIFFPLVTSIFLFILISNWMGILPGFGTIGRVESAEEVIHHVEAKEEKADLDKIKLQVFEDLGPMSIIQFGSLDDVVTAHEIEEHALEEGKQAGMLVPFFRSANTEINTTLAIALVAMFMVHFWGFKTLGLMGHVGKFINFKSGPIGIFVGLLEAISEIAKVISFTFRLFGNVFAGEVLLMAMAFLLPLVGIIPFLGLELFVGLIQAFIFSILTLVFATVATTGHGSQEH